MILGLPTGVLGAVILDDGGDAAALSMQVQRPSLTGQGLD